MPNRANPPRLLCIALLACAIALSACSSSSDGDDGSGGSPDAGGGDASTDAGRDAGPSFGNPDASANVDDAGAEDAAVVTPVGMPCVVGDYLYPDGTSDIVAADGCNRCSCNDGQLGCTRIACPAPNPDECLVGVRLGLCCERYQPATRAEIAADECLVPYPAFGISRELHARCEEQNELDCTVVDCAPDPLPSRVAAPDGQGGCTYADECTQASDCVNAWQITGSCCGACRESWPRTLVEQVRCLSAGEETGSAAACGPGCTMQVSCGACPEPTEPTCVVQDSWNECR